jgi:hypothetical protein
MLPTSGTDIKQQLRRTLVRLDFYSTNRSLTKFFFILNFSFFIIHSSKAQPKELDQYNVVWTEQSQNASQSMPCGGGSIGTNVWVENGEIFLYLQQSGWFDENNTFLKAGRIRINLLPNPFAGKTFRQELVLKDGYINIKGSNGKLSADVNVWVDLFKPVVQIDIRSNHKINATATYESWRYRDRETTTKENFGNSWKWAKVKVVTTKDSIGFINNEVQFFHQNKGATIFDYTIKQQDLLHLKTQLTNPLDNLISGGAMSGYLMKPVGTISGKYMDSDFKGWQLKSTSPRNEHSINIFLVSSKHNSIDKWRQDLNDAIYITPQESSHPHGKASTEWWHNYWNRSFIYIYDTHVYDTTWRPVEEISKNYNLFRYQLGCNAIGSYPTRFNGGLFTVDPVLTDTSNHGTPDHRNWGGGLFTAQNQRLVYWPMLKSGDVDLMKPQFDFYKNLLVNAELRTKTYWNHNGACFTEQMENFGLPNPAEYGYKRPADFDKGVEYNAWLEYEWDTVLEFCQMILETEKYQNKDIREYIPLIESCLVFFDEHYQYLAKQRGAKALDGNGHLVLYPGSGAETYKMSYNSTSTIAALQTVTKTLLGSAYLKENRKQYFTELLKRIPPISFRNMNEHTTISPANLWERVNNTEPTQLYPVFPWGIYGVGKPGLDTAINTYLYDTLATKFRSHTGWKQDNIFAARLGLTDEAKRLALLKLGNSKNKFPSFWGPGYDWTPDHNHGGAGMIGLQEMLLQTDDKKIILFPAWPKDWDVHFKLHAPYNTTVEATVKNGKLEQLEVWPKEREKDIVNMF